MNREELDRLDGALVFVRPGEVGTQNPEVGMRGTIHVSDAGAVSIHLDYPAMFYGQVRKQRIELNAQDVERLVRSEHDENYTFEVDGPLKGPPTKR